MLTAKLRRLRRDDRGITLMELVVAMGITTILGTVAIFFFVGAEHAGSKSVLTNQDTGDARVTLDSWTAMLRVAGWLDPSAQTDRFEEITPTKIVFYANLNNRTTADQQVGTVTKVALMLRTDPSTGDGQLIQVMFQPDNTSVQSVRELAFNASPTGGSGQAVFQPYLRTGGVVDTINTTACKNGNQAVSGLCLQSPPAGAGMLDPQVAATSLAVSAGPLRGNSAQNVDETLANIGSITVAFTVSDPKHTTSMDFASSAAVNSGFPA